MATDPEAQAQLARLLRDESLRSASDAELRRAVDRGFEALVEGVVAEAAASDDVTGQESAMSFVQLRLQSLTPVLEDKQAARLVEAVREKISRW